MSSPPDRSGFFANLVDAATVRSRSAKVPADVDVELVEKAGESREFLGEVGTEMAAATIFLESVSGPTFVAAKSGNVYERACLHNPMDRDLFGDEIRVSHNRSLDEPDPFERPSLPFQKRTRQLSAAMNELPLGSVLVVRPRSCSIAATNAASSSTSPAGTSIARKGMFDNCG